MSAKSIATPGATPFLARPAVWIIAWAAVWLGARIVLESNGVPTFARVLAALDELERRIQLEALAIAFVLAVLFIMTLGLMELAVTLNRNDWSYRHVWAMLPMLYFAGLVFARRRYA